MLLVLVGLMEMLTIAKDTDLCTKEFKVDELTRHFSTANAEATIAASGSSDRNRMKGARAGGNGVARRALGGIALCAASPDNG